MIIIHGSLFDHSQKHISESRNHPVCRTVFRLFLPFAGKKKSNLPTLAKFLGRQLQIKYFYARSYDTSSSKVHGGKYQ